ncbi:MAG: citrate lyase acyl carrier protein [Eubacteriaceae bacterium]|jgi:citrate lyase subunit gamma (acyl carrier protein)|nr:citrate lyase acyl carrier protein [Eubacteriaceae bacterium]
MNITKRTIAGTLESCDCLVTVYPDDKRVIILNSVSAVRFGKHLNHLINNTLDDLGLVTGKVEIEDKGALDYCIVARITAAVERGVR